MIKSLYSTLIAENDNEADDLVIIPEKPSILAEERIFVYVPKVTNTTAGIAKFRMDQFNIVNGQVSLKPTFVEDLKTFLGQPLIEVSKDTPTEEHYQLWYKVIESVK